MQGSGYVERKKAIDALAKEVTDSPSTNPKCKPLKYTRIILAISTVSKGNNSRLSINRFTYGDEGKSVAAKSEVTA
eukprot:CAMPEP_0113686140 /NCGR_PEP_ID=MMETSP0038_2-20120614/15112_1 /TAXON_ID=2898 /ORGANISM="Cryptomonas paramecium" /LENGTH=75 /DNA_ID=CAMNT_0000606405 /DNA_START=254 /DNA_END=481 /DNA_ORIENTATION=- /assembly_acc=CAM_ASM_000170